MQRLSDNGLEITQAIAKTAEQGGAAIGTSLGIYQILIEHQELITILCMVVSVIIAFLGYITSSAINFYFKRKHLKLAENQTRRVDDSLNKYE